MKRFLVAILSLVLFSAVAGLRLQASNGFRAAVFQGRPAAGGGNKTAVQSGSGPRIVDISAKRFEFTPNQITLERGKPVILRVASLDREHGFYQKDLNLDLELTPAQPSLVTITPNVAGRFVVICDEFCGSGHGNMKMVINVE